MIVLGLLLPALAAYPLVRAAVLPRGPEPLAGVARIAAALLLGLSSSGLTAFAALLGGVGLGRGYVAADALLFASLAAAGFTLRRDILARSPRTTWSWSRMDVAAMVLLAVAAAVATAAFLDTAARSPHGSWDACTIWNLKARFFYRGGEDWRAAFAPARSHPEYPLTLPLAVARLLAYGGESSAAHVAVAGVFTIGAPLVLAGVVAARGGAVAGAVAGLLLFATPDWLRVGAVQYADVPVAALLLLGVAAAELARPGAASRAAAFAGGLALGLAGFTKNEGLAGAAWAVVAWGALAWRARGLRAAGRELGAVGAGAALPALAWVTFHLALSPEIAPELTADQTAASFLSRISDPGRWSLVLPHALSTFPGGDRGLPAVLLGSVALLGVSRRDLPRSPALLVAIALYLEALLVFAVTPSPLEWHLTTAMSRLLLQPWPLLLLGVFAAVRAPEEAPAPVPSAEPAHPR
jgi:hypothetical protein